MTFKKIAIIGAGQMGQGIAYSSAISGYQVTLYDIHHDKLTQAIGQIQALGQKNLDKQKISETQHSLLHNQLTTATTMEQLADCDFIIEAATEQEALKIEIFQKLHPLINSEAIFATNTSSLSVTKLALSSGRAAQFMGVHFMNPVPVMPLVELIKGLATSDETFSLCTDYVKTLGKDYAISQDFPAFIVNRVLIPMINEAIFVLYEGISDKESIDKAMTLGTNMPMGPLALADLIGLDTCLAIMNRLYTGFNDSKYRPCPLLVQYVEAGYYGRKTKKGFYDYA